ncbi:MAG: GTP cyclohydrolase I FolE2 [candidate division Zixibacteria bacterium HGW-Zixibacteria-1]|nr:MAG: GTP cyclohydrolase I FolE2 [candidate division Zixibacteria bacterium HGW-Zixibacteria-1]
MKDMQSSPDNRNIHIDKVGIKNLKLPIVVKDQHRMKQATVADVNFYVDLPHQFKGTHMSRFVEILNEHKDELDISSLESILRKTQKKLHAYKAHLELTFPYFIKKKAPVTGAEGILDYECTISAATNGGEKMDITNTIRVPVTTLCPCSKEISKYGAHNQRSIVTLSVRTNVFIWLEELIELIEKEASCEIYSLLKRPDEKYVTEKMYENPRFVEDIVRGVTERLTGDGRIDWFTIESDNIESIHNHNAYAFIERNLKAEREETDRTSRVREMKKVSIEN